MFCHLRLAVNTSNSAKGNQREPSKKTHSQYIKQYRIQKEIVNYAPGLELMKRLTRLQCKRMNKSQGSFDYVTINL